MRLIATILLIVPVLSGCSYLGPEWSAENIRRNFVQNHAEISMRIGAIDGFLGNDANEIMPVVLVGMKNQLREIAVKDPNEMTDYEIGYFMGLQSRFVYELTKVVAQWIVPESAILERYLP